MKRVAEYLAACAALAIASTPYLYWAVRTLMGDSPMDGIDSLDSIIPGLWVRFWGIDLASIILVLIAVFAFWILVTAASAAVNRIREPGRTVEKGIFGSQRSESGHGAILQRCYTWAGGMPEHPGFVAGFVRGRYIVTPATHAVFCAPSGSGKTRSSVLPSIACLSRAENVSLVITDPSLEIWCYSRQMLEKAGCEAVLVDFENPYRGVRVNPLEPLIAMNRQGRGHLAEERAMEIGAMLFPPTGGDGDAFSQPAAGLVAALSYIVATCDDIPDAERNLRTVLRIILSGTSNGTGPLKDWIRGFGVDHPAVAMSSSFLAATDRYESSILGVLNTGLMPLSTSAMQYLLSGGDFSLSCLLRERSALVIHTLPSGAPANRIASLLFNQLWATIASEGQRRGSVKETYWLLDEAHSIPPFSLMTVMEQGRKFGVHMGLYLQSFSGLDSYKTAKEDGKDAILANCDAKCLFRAGSVSDAEYFERIGGKRTVLARGEGGSRSPNGLNANVSFSERDSPVWQAGEIMQRDPTRDGVLLFQNPTGHPSMMGKFEVPIQEISKIPFMCKQLRTVGSRDFEKDVIARELDLLDGLAEERSGANARGDSEWLQNLLELLACQDRENSDSELEVFGL